MELFLFILSGVSLGALPFLALPTFYRILAPVLLLLGGLTLARRRPQFSEIFESLPLSLILGSMLISLDVTFQYIFDRINDRSGVVLRVGNSALVLALLWLCLSRQLSNLKKMALSRKISEKFLEGFSPATRRAFSLSLNLAAIALVIPAHLAIWRTHYHHLVWYYDFLDKRWLYATYWLGVGLFMLLPLFLTRIFSDPLSAHSPLSRADQTSSFARLGAGLLAVLFATYCWGPPWNAATLLRPLDWHELIHLGPLQAIKLGQIPYTEARNQYGPGNQLWNYFYMKSTGWDFAHFRDSFSAINFIGSIILAVLCAVILSPPAALLAILFSFKLSPLSVYRFLPSGEMTGGFGWYSVFRYLGILATLSLFHLVFWRFRKKGAGFFLTGMVWGFFCWFAQENLSGTILALSLYGSILWVTRTETLRGLVKSALLMGLGFLTIWSPVIVYYGAHHQLSDFIHNYFLVTSAVLAGGLNIPFDGGDLWRHYVFLPYLAGGVALAASYSLKSRNFISSLTEPRATLIFLSCTSLACHQMSLFRTDSPHIVITMVALPLLLAALLIELPKLFHEKWLIRAVVACILAWMYTWTPLSGWIPEKRSWNIHPHLLSGDLLGIQYPDTAPCCIFSKTKMSVLMKGFDDIHRFIGSRRTFVSDFIEYNKGFVYYFSDLIPAVRNTESMMTVWNSELFKIYMDELKTASVDCLVARYLHTEEARWFLSQHPRTEEITVSFAEVPIHVICGLD